MSKLKTVWDAVNELRGEWIFECKESWEKKTNHIITFESKLASSARSFHDNFMVINYTEFSALVEEMTLGLDVNGVTHGELFDYVNADKTLLEKDSTVNKQPVYTQEMANNGELPSVGSEFLHKGSVATTLSTSKEHGGVVTFTVDNGCSIDCCWFNDAWVNPIDTRTKKQKAIDEIESELSKIAYSTRSALELAYDEWVGE